MPVLKDSKFKLDIILGTKLSGVPAESRLRLFGVAITALILFVSILIFPTQPVAAGVPDLPEPGTMVAESQQYNPPIIKGLKVYPENPLLFDFIVDIGQSGLTAEDPSLAQESSKLIKYFLATLTVPDDDLWVNLSPYEEDRTIPDGLGNTELGRDMLMQDYLLKQVTASLMYPEKDLGKEFWNKVYQRISEKYGTTKIPVSSFSKVWIVPEKAVLFVKDNRVFILESRLKVMLEEDYLAVKSSGQIIQKMQGSQAGESKSPLSTTKAYASGDLELTAKAVKEILLPAIEEEVNLGKNFHQLRQIYNSVILATWFKDNIKKHLLRRVYIGKNKVDGVDVEDKEIKQKIYDQFVADLKHGVYNYVKEDYDAETRKKMKRRYFSGGVHLSKDIVRKAMESVAVVSPEQAASFAGSSYVDVSSGLVPLSSPVPGEEEGTSLDKFFSRVVNRRGFFKTGGKAGLGIAVAANLPGGQAEAKPVARSNAPLFDPDAPVSVKDVIIENFGGKDPARLKTALAEAKAATQPTTTADTATRVSGVLAKSRSSAGYLSKYPNLLCPRMPSTEEYVEYGTKSLIPEFKQAVADYKALTSDTARSAFLQEFLGIAERSEYWIMFIQLVLRDMSAAEEFATQLHLLTQAAIASDNLEVKAYGITIRMLGAILTNVHSSSNFTLGEKIPTLPDVVVNFMHSSQTDIVPAAKQVMEAFSALSADLQFDFTKYAVLSSLPGVISVMGTNSNTYRVANNNMLAPVLLENLPTIIPPISGIVFAKDIVTRQQFIDRGLEPGYVDYLLGELKKILYFLELSPGELRLTLPFNNIKDFLKEQLSEKDFNNVVPVLTAAEVTDRAEARDVFSRVKGFYASVVEKNGEGSLASMTAIAKWNKMMGSMSDLLTDNLLLYEDVLYFASIAEPLTTDRQATVDFIKLVLPKLKISTGLFLHAWDTGLTTTLNKYFISDRVIQDPVLKKAVADGLSLTKEQELLWNDFNVLYLFLDKKPYQEAPVKFFHQFLSDTKGVHFGSTGVVRAVIDFSMFGLVRPEFPQVIFAYAYETFSQDPRPFQFDVELHEYAHGVQQKFPEMWWKYGELYLKLATEEDLSRTNVLEHNAEAIKDWIWNGTDEFLRDRIASARQGKTTLLKMTLAMAEIFTKTDNPDEIITFNPDLQNGGVSPTFYTVKRKEPSAEYPLGQIVAFVRPDGSVIDFEKLVDTQDSVPNAIAPSSLTKRSTFLYIQGQKASVNFAVYKPSNVTFEIYDFSGRLVYKKTSPFAVGRYREVWDGRTNGGRKLATGNYIMNIRADSNDSRNDAKAVGGIDLSPEKIDLEVTGAELGETYTMPKEVAEHLEGITIKGFSPIIFQIVPATDIPALLGVTK